MQTQRLFEILYILLRQRKTTAKQLAAHFEVSVRTIYRDLDVLTLAHIPIYTTKGAKGGIFLMEDHVLSKSYFSDEEQQRILSALHTLQAADQESDSHLATKLAAIFQKEPPAWINVDFSTWNQGSLENDLFATIKTAILSRLQISFHYYDTQGNCDVRIVEPLQLLFKGQAWYVIAYCTHKNDQRTFKLKRIRQLIVLDEPCHHTLTSVHTQYQAYANTLIELTLEIKLSSAYRVYEEFLDADIIKERDHFLIHTKMPDGEMLYGILLSYGADLKVQSPKHVKDHYHHLIKQMYHQID